MSRCLVLLALALLAPSIATATPPLSPALADASELESEGAGPCDDPPRPLPRRRQWTSETGVGLSLGFPTGLKIREALTAPSGLLLGGDADLHTVLIYSGASAGLGL